MKTNCEMFWVLKTVFVLHFFKINILFDILLCNAEIHILIIYYFRYCRLLFYLNISKIILTNHQYENFCYYTWKNMQSYLYFSDQSQKKYIFNIYWPHLFEWASEESFQISEY